jgi:hypothetical protein
MHSFGSLTLLLAFRPLKFTEPDTQAYGGAGATMVPFVGTLPVPPPHPTLSPEGERVG